MGIINKGSPWKEKSQGRQKYGIKGLLEAL